MTRTEICHCPGGAYYDRIVHSSSYPDLGSCLAAGGREPQRGQGVCHGTSDGPAPRHATSRPAQTAPASRDYDRDRFGHGWADTNGDCMNTRHETLRDLSTGPVTLSRDACSVTHGRWVDPYTDRIFSDPGEMDIDHVVPLSFAWAHGADRWSDRTRERFANDPVNLMPVESSANRRKSDSGPLEWLPPSEGYACEYVLRFNRVSKSYGLVFSDEEGARMRRQITELCS